MANSCKCGKPTRDDRYVCDKCKDELEQALGNVPFIAEQIEIAVTGQRAAVIGSGSASSERGLPWHERASTVGRDLHGLLVSWVRFCREEHLRATPPPVAGPRCQTCEHETCERIRNGDWPADNLKSLSAWLLACVDRLALHDIGSEAVDEITSAVADCRRVVFWKRRERVYLGSCGLACSCACHPDGQCEGCACADRMLPEPCPGEVYADPDAAVGECDDCRRGHTVVIRRGELEQQLDDRLCTPGEIARMSTFLGLDVPRTAVRNKVNYWSRHKRIMPASHADNGDPLFRYGEVRGMLYREFAAPQSKGA